MDATIFAARETGFGPKDSPRPPTLAAGFCGAPVPGADAAEPSMIATPRPRPQSKQFPPLRLQELVALDDPGLTYGQVYDCKHRKPQLLTTRLFDHLVGAAKQRKRKRNAECLGGLHVEDQPHYRHPLHRQI